MEPPRHSRRDFLRGRSAAAAAAGAIDSLLEARLGPAVEVSPRDEHRVVTLSRRAMACDFELRLPTGPAGDADTAAGMAALDVVERVEDRLTVYRDQSDLIDLNFQAAAAPVEVDASLFDMLSLCGRIHRESGGAFDPTSGPLSRAWGFHRREGRTPPADELATALARVGWDGVELDPQRRTVRFLREGLELNANSIGKGYALDLAAEALTERGAGDWLMHGGRSTLLARGDNPGLAGGGWRAGLRDPLRPERRVAEITLRNEALSTSGSGTQFFEHEGRRYGHLIDPRTGWPAEGLYSATVVAKTAAEADAYSTAAYILGEAGTAELCRRTGLRALVLAPDADGGVRVAAYNLAPEDWAPEA